MSLHGRFNQLISHYSTQKNSDELGAALITREELAKFVLAHSAEIEQALRRYELPLNAEADNVEGDGT